MRVINKRDYHSGDAVYIGRPSPLGNPYRIGEHGDRLQVITMYAEWLTNQVLTRNQAVLRALRSINEMTNLQCWCKPDVCHGDVIQQVWHDMYDEIFTPYVAVFGSRTYPDLDDVAYFVDCLPDNAVVVSGGAMGVDLAAEQAAEARGLRTLIFPADWDRYGKRAGYMRNVDIANASDIGACFWYNHSKGSKITLDLMTQRNKLVEVSEINDTEEGASHSGAVRGLPRLRSYSNDVPPGSVSVYLGEVSAMAVQSGRH